MTEPTTPDERAEIVRLRRQATPGEWTACRMTHAERGGNLSPKELGEYVENSVIKSLAESGSLQFLFVSVDKEDGPADVCHVGNGPTSPANAAYIVAACNAADRLVADVERLEFLEARPVLSGAPMSQTNATDLAIAALEALEWGPDLYQFSPTCYWCGGYKRNPAMDQDYYGKAGHKPDCLRQRALDALTSERP